MFGVGWTEILVILVVALLVLGPSKLPEIAKGLGKGIRDFKKAMNSLDDDDEPRRPRNASYQAEVPQPPAPVAQAPQAPPPPGLPPPSAGSAPAEAAPPADDSGKPREG